MKKLINNKITEIKIEVLMFPHTWEDEEKPYGWWVEQWDEETKSWDYKYGDMAKTPLEAYKDAEKWVNENSILEL